MTPITLRRHEITLVPESARVIIRPFIPSSVHGITTIIGRALALSEEDATRDLEAVLQEFDSRHLDIESPLLANYERVVPHLFTQRPLSRARKLLIGALFSGEYALESAALFNPSIVPHPDQDGVPDGGLRFIMSLRATGEGHISSIEFRTGLDRARWRHPSGPRLPLRHRAGDRPQSQLQEDAVHRQAARDGLRQRPHRRRDGTARGGLHAERSESKRAPHPARDTAHDAGSQQPRSAPSSGSPTPTMRCISRRSSP